MLNRKKYNPVRAYSRKGKFLVAMVRTLFRIRRLFGGKDFDRPWSEHHEDPLHMTRKEQIYFGHKYYYRAITKADENSDLENYFTTQSAKFSVPETFTEESSLTLSAGGDLMPYSCINRKTCANLWDECGDFFFGADLVTANLETPIDLNKKVSLVPEVMLNHMYFNGDEEMYSVFSGLGKYRGYDVLSIANNHSLDQGEEGLKNTISFLEKKNVQYTGAAIAKDKRDDFPVIEKNGIRIAFLSATFSLNAEQLAQGKDWMVNHLQLNRENPDLSVLVEQAKSARAKKADLIVAFLHMGCAYQPYPSAVVTENMHRICRETGIDILFGGHPHNPQPLEFFECNDPFTNEPKTSFINYSFGDFVAYDIFKWCKLPLLLKLKISKGKLNGKEKVIISKIEAKLVYNCAEIKNGKVESLRFLDYKKLLANEATISDPKAKKEFEELKYFAETYLLPGNFDRFLV